MKLTLRESRLIEDLALGYVLSRGQATVLGRFSSAAPLSEAALEAPLCGEDGRRGDAGAAPPEDRP